MPELPEVQTVVTDLDEMISGRILQELRINDPKVWPGSENYQPANFIGKKLISVRRRGKYIVYDFGGPYLIQHLRMTGVMLPVDSSKIPHNLRTGNSPQLRLNIVFDDLELVFFDVRRFGTFESTHDLATFFATKNLAPELYDDFSYASQYFDAKIKKISRPIKSVLLDQSLICGPGNIYADEALHKALLHPLTPASSLSSRQAQNLCRIVKEIMDSAIAKRGTSASDYLDVNGNPGSFKEYLYVYKRRGLPCRTCESGLVDSIKIAGRTSHFCPECQKI